MSLLTDDPAKPQPSIRAERHADRADLYFEPGSVLIARRDEATGAVSWHHRMTAEDKEAAMRLFAKMPRQTGQNRAQRRRAAVLAKRAGRGKG
jgi:hypothetical protein